MRSTLFDMEKKQLRQYVIQQIKSLDKNEKEAHSQRICSEIIHTNEWQNRDILFAYYPLESEIDIRILLYKAWESSETPLALPCISGKRMNFYRVDWDMRDKMKLNNRGILEPLTDWEKLEPDNFSNPLMIIPGLAFTLSGKRLGRGGGFYDRYLGRDTIILKDLTKWAAAYPCQLGEDFPIEPHDISLDKIFF